MFKSLLLKEKREAVKEKWDDSKEVVEVLFAVWLIASFASKKFKQHHTPVGEHGVDQITPLN